MDEKLPNNVIFVPFQTAKDLSRTEEAHKIVQALNILFELIEQQGKNLDTLKKLSEVLHTLADNSIAKMDSEENEE